MLLEGERDLTRDSGEGWQSSFSWPEWCLKGYLPYNNLNNNSNYTLVLQGFLCLYFIRMKSFFFLIIILNQWPKRTGEVRASFPSKFMQRQLYQMKSCKWHHSFICSYNFKFLGANMVLRTLGNIDVMTKFPPLRISVFLPRQMFKQIKVLMWCPVPLQRKKPENQERTTAWESWGCWPEKLWARA